MGGRFFKLPDITTKVELTPFVAKHYDAILNIASLGIYPIFTKHAIEKAPFKNGDAVLDLGSGTGRFACLIKRKTNISKYVGVDLSEIMIRQARQRCSKFKNFTFIQGEIQKELAFKEEFDKVFISFVLHGFTQENRIAIIQNAYTALKPGGQFIILDYAEKDVNTSPFIIKFLIRKVECPLAEDFMNRNLEHMLSDTGFSVFQKFLFLGGYVREEIAIKK
jgi:ubiquinone/menaquinone biosynthesis C-methylase UbiE